MRFTQRINGIAVHVGDGFAMHLVGGTAVEFHVTRKRHRVGAGLPKRLAHVHRFERGEFIDLFQHKLADPGQDAAAFQRGHLAPCPCAGRVGRLDRRIDICRVAARDLADHAAVRRVHQIQ